MTLLKKFIGKFRPNSANKHQTAPLMSTYARIPVRFVRGEGCQLWDDKGNEYLDALGGIAVCFLGHSHKSISAAISDQAQALMHTSNLFEIPEQAKLGQRFCDIAQMDAVFFANSGTEANEAAIKISRRYAHARGIDNPIVLSAEGSFHGRSFGALSATGNTAIKEGFGPLLPGFEHVPYDNLDAIREYSSNKNVVAVMIEPIQGEAGIVIPSNDYLAGLRKICDDNNWLLIVDEIQAGMGRTGRWFAYQHAGIRPDVMTAAKALGNGYPIGACAARGEAARLLNPGAHGTTFGGNPLACKVGLTVIDTIENEGLLEAASELGEFLKAALNQQIGDLDNVVEIRGQGLMLAVELTTAYENLAMQFLELGLVVNITGGAKVIRMLPSALLSKDQCEQIAMTCKRVLDNNRS